MRLARKLFLLGAMALAALALTASSASAQADIEVYPEDGGEPCGTVILDVHDVSGGCHVEFQGNIPLYAHIPGETPVSNCHVNLEVYLGEDGEGYVGSAVLSAPTGPPGGVPCTRAPCDEANGTFRPWPVHLVEHGAGDEEVEATFCLRGATEQPGVAGSQCEVHLELENLGGHHYEVGHELVHEFCEVSPNPFPVSIRDHLESQEITGEEVELIHHL